MEILEKQISDIILKVFNLDVDCHVDNSFYYNVTDNILGFMPYWYNEDKIIDYNWQQWIQDTFNVEFAFWQVYPISFLHELGHKITMPHLTEDEIEKPYLIEDDLQYYNTKREYVATAWAIRMCLHHADWLIEFCADLDKALQEFYLRHDITE